MNSIYKFLINTIPTLLVIAILLFLQLFFIKIQLIALYPITLLIFRRNTLHTLFITFTISLFYDAVFLSTIGLWAVANSIAMLLITLAFYRFKIEKESSIDIDKSLIAGCMIWIAAVIHTTLYNSFTQSPHYTIMQIVLLAVVSFILAFTASSRHNASFRRIL